MDMCLNNKVALITGGSRGIGKAVALTLAKQGAKIVFCGRTKHDLDATADFLRKKGAETWAFQADMSKVRDIENLVEHVVARVGGINILVNNAVTSESAPFDQLTDDMFRYHIDVKLMAYIRIARLVLPHMRKTKSGRIVNIGGMTARVVAPLRISNGVVNAGIANFTKQFATFAAQYNITVNCVHPGYTLTERVKQIFVRQAEESGDKLDNIIRKRTKEVPLGKLMKPEDIASAVLFFCSPLAGMITGQSLAVDGGSGNAIAY
ncbi:MAG: 3-oxoacyl-[acyl-carrier-protein] reductase FabG [Alphaproteobacteria bacterium MarineAlpha3_Bin5]|nr:MAG: 3-oxoacyl-[acyl-carrier-protein] reductase FabG [Alphaproteobacteria bacterium MarineAlpha3_Bin5]